MRTLAVIMFLCAGINFGCVGDDDDDGGGDGCPEIPCPSLDCMQGTSEVTLPGACCPTCEPVDAGSGDPCADGFAQGDPNESRTCNATQAGVCFETDEQACACAGCPLRDCLIAESYPTQVSCQ